eukprot:CAMPEP_0197883970 /NCGR_PEP_ID=MMETSP1439-20131203/10602_1 /TAXON_ID=66791 /ORGANISM="Gonyaulax spinifera, Strain CCMP409" /LENGTH=35 /DNA_ID= /DNA_START= /DNA_END= /DNA_ORIENTATION=
MAREEKSSALLAVESMEGPQAGPTGGNRSAGRISA